MAESPDEIAGRIRAAFAYAGLNEKAAAEVIGFSKRTLARVESGERDLTIPEAKLLAAATGVPMRFLLDGWEVYEDIEQRVKALRDDLTQLQTVLEARRLDAAERELEVGRRLDAVERQVRQARSGKQP